MKHILVLIAFAVWTAFAYSAGHAKARSEYLAQLYDVEQTVSQRYKQQVANMEASIVELQQTAQQYQQAADAMRDDADELRMQLKRAADHARAVSNTSNQSCPTKELQDRCSAKMEAVLIRATDFAEERDQIALHYNELREQCQLK